ncbi:MAG: hypothetical protein E7083_00035 [Bacteroidales bacterium]|nr:hypothetical protein [Bacteroidales bacterium]
MTKAELKQKFRAGQYPTENDFAELIDMILTPTAEIPQKNIIGLLSALQGKYNKERGESLEASIENLVNNLNAEITRAKQVESEKANSADIINSLFKGTLYLNNNSDAIYKDAALTDIDNQHDADSAGIWIIRGNSVVGIMSRGWNEATIYPHNARYLIHWVWSEERGQWVRSEIAKSYTITEAERNKWNNVITNLSTETTRAQNAESALQKSINAEKSRAEEAEATLSSSIKGVADNATETFATKTALSEENKRAVGAEQILQKAITAETTRAQNAETALRNNIDKEKTRATQAENALAQSIETVAESALETFATKEQLTAENKRATEVEQTLQKNITAETTRAQNAETALQGEVDSLKIGSINTMQEGAQVVTDATSGKFGLLLTSRAGNIDNWRQRLITFTGILERRWDRTIGNMGGNWSPIWNTVLEWDKITTFGSDVSNNTLTLTGSNMADDTTAIIMQQATVYNNTLIL